MPQNCNGRQSPRWQPATACHHLTPCRPHQVRENALSACCSASVVCTACLQMVLWCPQCAARQLAEQYLQAEKQGATALTLIPASNKLPDPCFGVLRLAQLKCVWKWQWLSTAQHAIGKDSPLFCYAIVLPHANANGGFCTVATCNHTWLLYSNIM